MTKRIGIDVDLTLVSSDNTWLEWLIDKSGSRFDYKNYSDDLNCETVDYNLSTYFTLPENLNPLSFWSERDTYDNVDLLPNSVRVIKNLYEAGYEIVFISYCMGCPDQIASKLKFLKMEFNFLLPNDFNFVPTKKKHLVNVDYLIDDRHQFLGSMDEHVELVKIKTPYTQDYPLDREHTLVENWLEIEDYFCNELEK